jgi:hypothetical protein
MDVPCPACSRGPTGFAGHDDLTVQTIGDGRMMLRCRSCGSFWSRTLEKEGYFAWAALTERMAAGTDMGIAVPHASLAAGHRGLPWRGSDIAGRPPRGAHAMFESEQTPLWPRA